MDVSAAVPESAISPVSAEVPVSPIVMPESTVPGLDELLLQAERPAAPATTTPVAPPTSHTNLDNDMADSLALRDAHAATRRADVSTGTGDRSPPTSLLIK
jgi:hypothetical protein